MGVSMSRMKAFNRDRDAAMRSLDRGQLEKFLRKWDQPRPKTWIGDAWLAAMHKGRLQIDTFTEAEKAVSRTWLAQNGYTEKVGSAGPCPACGSIGPSLSDCRACGVVK